MRPPLLASVLLLAVAACSVPFTTSRQEKKAPCDRIAARAIQSNSLDEAKNLAAQASACYARAQSS